MRSVSKAQEPQQAAYSVKEIFPTQEERVNGRFETHNTQKILEGLHGDGIIVIRDIIDPKHLDALNDVMVPEVPELLKTAHFNFNVRNIQHAPPLVPSSLVFDDIYANPLLCHAVTLYLGPDAKFNFISGNTALPKGADRQPVHCDLNFNYPNCPFYLVAYIPLIDSTPEVGSTEFWPGTHIRSYAEQAAPEYYKIKEDHLASYKGLRPVVPKGSLVLRDMRLWHAGMPNPSDLNRCMLGLAFCSSWYRTKSILAVPEEVLERLTKGLKSHGINPLLHGLPEAEYLKKKDAYSFTFDQDIEEWTPPPQDKKVTSAMTAH